MLYDLAAISSYAFLKMFFGFKIEGRKHLLGLSSFILVSNHISNLDPVILAAAVYPHKLRFMAKKELFKNQLFGLLIKSLGSIPVDRSSSGINSLRKVLKVIKARPVLIFPQGTRSADFSKVNYGAGFLCKKSQVPVIAARIYGSDEVLPKYSKFFKKGKIRIVLSRIRNLDYRQDHKTITNRIVEGIKTL